MKTVTAREFFHTPSLVNCLRPSEMLVVTKNGCEHFVVTKKGTRTRKTADQFRAQHRRLQKLGIKKTFDSMSLLSDLRK
jgi:hypothetical protein